MYPNWRWFPSAPLRFAMDVVGMELAQWLALRRIAVTLYSQGADLVGSSLVRDGAEHRRVPRLFDVATRLLGLQMRVSRLVRGEQASESTPLLYRLEYGVLSARDLKKRRFDVAHIHILDQFVPIVRRLAPETRIVLHMHDQKQIFRDRARTLRRLRQADAIVGCSAFTTAAVAQRFPELADRCQPILNAVDLDRFQPRQDHAKHGGKRLLFVGRLSPEKGVHALLSAFARVLERHPEAELRLVGPEAGAPLADVDPHRADPRFGDLYGFYEPGRYRLHLDRLMPPNVRARVSFGEPLAHERTPREFRDSDLVVFPSVWDEPFGLPVLEAMASGKPVVASRVGGIPEIVSEGHTGLLVEPGNVSQLADAITSLLDNPERMQTMGEKGRSRACSEFAWERRIDEWIYLYRRLVDSPRPG